MLRLESLGLAILVCACSDGAEPAAVVDGSAADAPADAAAMQDSAPEATTPADAAGDAPFDAAPFACQTDEAYAVPPQNLAGWSPVLSQGGALTLTHDTGHSHDDGHGALGFCPANVAKGTRYLALVSARYETDQQDQTFTSTSPCVPDYLAPDPTFQKFGMCFSGGNHNIYVEVRDESGKRVVAGFEVFHGAATDPVSDQGKPAGEFPMNYPIYGHADQRYGVHAVYKHPVDGPLLSDAVTNMRMPFSHHVDYLLTFQVKTK